MCKTASTHMSELGSSSSPCVLRDRGRLAGSAGLGSSNVRERGSEALNLGAYT